MGNESTMHRDANAPERAPAGGPPPLPPPSLPPPLPSDLTGRSAADLAGAAPITTESTRPPPTSDEIDPDAAIESRWSDLTTLYAEYDAAAGPAPGDPAPDRAELVGPAAGAPGSPPPVTLPDDVRDIDDLVRFRDGRDEPVRRLRVPGRRLSWLGLAAMLAGIAACVFTQWPVGRASPTLVGSIAGAAAILALLVSIARGRTGSGVPVLALLLCLAAVAVDRYHVSPKSPGTTGGWVKQQIDRVGPALGGNPPAGTTPPPAVSTAVAPPVSVAPTAPAPRDPKTASPSGSKLFPLPGADATDGGFDVTYGSTDPPAPAKSAAPVNPSPAAPAPASKTPVSPVVSPEYKAAVAARQRAEERVRSAESRFAEQFDRTPAGKAARAEVDAATELVERLKKQYDPYAPALVEAARRRIEAQEKLNRLRETAMASDPTVVAARNELDAADDRLRATAPAVAAPAPGKR